ncbi:Amidase [Cynara cardunculus var. scolymus]|uniref:Amidase n=1 Tax=Cynara cardunculus var. scolymus TaxID=59895 RepID=A0A103YKS2_CYNCS|nr:Amidase [Cynara cardunculus var. scolymus]
MVLILSHILISVLLVDAHCSCVGKPLSALDETTRNPHNPERYTGGSSSGPAAIVASGICSAALGTDGGGCIHIKAMNLHSFLQLNMVSNNHRALCGGRTVEILGPIASTVEDIMLVILGSMRLGKYSEWFNDVFSPDISTKCEDVLNLLSETHGCKGLRAETKKPVSYFDVLKGH